MLRQNHNIKVAESKQERFILDLLKLLEEITIYVNQLQKICMAIKSTCSHKSSFLYLTASAEECAISLFECSKRKKASL